MLHLVGSWNFPIVHTTDAPARCPLVHASVFIVLYARHLYNCCNRTSIIRLDARCPKRGEDFSIMFYNRRMRGLPLRVVAPERTATT